MKDIITWFFKSFGVFLLGIPVTLLGFPMVALALPFRITHSETERPFTDQRFPVGTHTLVTLPFWAKPWDNLFDGAEGDIRGYWNNECLSNWGRTGKAFWSMWVWLAVRNPANYWSRVMTGVDVSQCNIVKLAGDDVVEEKPGLWQWQFLCATHANGKKYHRLFCVFPWFFKPDHAVMIDIGWKIKLSHNDVLSDAPVKDRVKGSVFTPSPWKKL